MTRWSLVAAVVLTALVWVGSIVVYPMLPERIPTHWDIQGRVDGCGEEAWAVFLMQLSSGWWGLCAVLPWMSPASFKIDTFRSTYGYIVIVLVAMMGYAQATTLVAAAGRDQRLASDYGGRLPGDGTDGERPGQGAELFSSACECRGLWRANGFGTRRTGWPRVGHVCRRADRRDGHGWVPHRRVWRPGTGRGGSDCVLARPVQAA